MSKGSVISDNHANQCNPNNSNYNGGSSSHSAVQNNNHANQCNTNNSASKGGK